MLPIKNSHSRSHLSCFMFQTVRNYFTGVSISTVALTKNNIRQLECFLFSASRTSSSYCMWCSKEDKKYNPLVSEIAQKIPRPKGILKKPKWTAKYLKSLSQLQIVLTGADDTFRNSSVGAGSVWTPQDVCRLNLCSILSCATITGAYGVLQ